MTDDATPHGNTGNRANARDPEGTENMNAKIQFFCYPEEKSAWIRAAHPQRLSAWIRHQLNTATGRPERPDPEEWRQIRK
jgi:hypothetical protein